MVRTGDHSSLLDPLHTSGCDGREYSTCRPVVLDGELEVVFAAWCGECGAADYEVI